MLVKYTLIGNFQGQMLIAGIGAVHYIAIKSNVKPSQNLMAILHGTGWLICTKKTLIIMQSIITGEA